MTAIADLQNQLDLSETKIYSKIRQKINQYQQRCRQNKPTDQMLQQIEQQLRESQHKVAAKQAIIGKVTLADLPVAEHADEIAAAIKNHQVIIIAGETGSGKTTQLPKICLQLGYGARGLIGHTQPRRLAARTVATRIAEELDSTLGQKVGYQVRFTEQVSDATLIKLMTDGILLAETQHDPLLEKYQVLILDEAHERSLNIDFLLGYIKRILPKRPDLKLIITSATIDLQKFSQHFDSAPILQVSGRTYPVDVLYRPLLREKKSGSANGEQETATNKEVTQVQAILDAVDEITQFQRQAASNAPRDILIFLSGEREIREAAENLRKAQLRNTLIMPLYARLSVSEQNKIFQTNQQSARRIILATNVAETSVTVPGIGYVIDTGFARISRYSFRSKVQRLPIEAISQASANQRSGRCGRIAPGTCIRLYSEQDFSGRSEFTDAEIRRTNLAAVILQMLNLKLGDIAKFPFIDPPDSRFITDGFKLLEELGAVNGQKSMTPLGRQLAKLPVDPRIGRMIIEANQQNSLAEVLIIASALSVQDPKERPLDKQQAADLCHREYLDEDSDFVSFVNLWHSYEVQRQQLSSGQLRKYCSKHFLNFMRMREWRDVHRQLHLACKSLGYKEQTTPASYQAVHVALLSGLLSHIGFKQENKEFLGARNRRFLIFPGSTQYKKPAKWLMVSELVETSKLYGRTAAKIDPLWLEPLAKHLIKKSYLEPKWQKSRAQVTANEQVVLFGLIIVQKRVVNYGAINPRLSQEIFIRSALVEGHYHTKAAFFQHNQQLLAEVEHLEAKSRRRDLLVDEDTLYDFYAQKIASLHDQPVVNGAAFEKWRKQLELSQPKALFFQQSDVLQRSSEHVSERDYPNKLEYKGVKLELSYHFDPTVNEDGVSLHLPVALLKQFSRERLEWLVPGMLKERCIALLKSLPKARRKHFVPIPDYVSAFVESANFANGSLIQQLCHHLLRMTGVRLEVSEFDQSVLDKHLQFNIKLIDNDAKEISQSRDIESLYDQYATLVDTELQQQGTQAWGKTGLSSWNFGELAETIETKQGGIKVVAWPALKKNGQTVDLILTMQKGYADSISITAINQLASLALVSVLKKPRANIPKITESTLFVGKKFTKKQLENEIHSFALREALSLQQSLPRTEAEYQARLAKVKSSAEYSLWLGKIAERVHQLHRQYHQLQKQLSGSQLLSTITVVSDMKQQLDRLFAKDYLSLISWYRLEQYTRYMKSMQIRLEKYQRDLPRQKLLSGQLNAMESRLQDKIQQCLGRDEIHPELAEYRWLIEEYRISLFSQQLGTNQSVSEKKMQQKWREIDL
ncbi:MAG: ATP-dependent RNA helicase HrpA [Pseudomonadales bacterium]|nr:ATP-dependent RNA helicase HrpA [Pseudomonadales bacterium]NRA14417.1 ATP-dependent RNA helicase HrpA [Oceanospirillaceae bacterium]